MIWWGAIHLTRRWHSSTLFMSILVPTCNLPFVHPKHLTKMHSGGWILELGCQRDIWENCNPCHCIGTHSNTYGQEPISEWRFVKHQWKCINLTEMLHHAIFIFHSDSKYTEMSSSQSQASFSFVLSYQILQINLTLQNQ